MLQVLDIENLKIKYKYNLKKKNVKNYIYIGY